MKPGLPVRSAARKVVGKCLRDGAFATRILPGESAGLEARDADLVREISLGVLRNLSRLDHVLSSAARRPLREMPREMLDSLRVALYQILFLDRIPAHAAVALAVDDVRDVSGETFSKVANGILRTLLRTGHLDRILPEPAPVSRRLAVEFSLPEWWVMRLLASHDEEEARRIAADLNRPSTIDLAVNLRKASVSSVLAGLASLEIRAERVAGIEGAIRLPEETRPPLALLNDGSAAVVDLSAQWVASLVQAPPCGRVLDAAAAPGGKSLVVSSLFPSATLVSSELEVSRIERLAANAASWRLPQRILAADMLRAPFRAALFDVVILDAPCSGTGTMRKNPEIRWQLDPSGLARHSERQAALIRAAAVLVAPGGALLYSTCSLEPEENEAVVGAFLEEHSKNGKNRWRAEVQDLPSSLPARRTGGGDAPGVRLWPGLWNDGHTAFVLRKSPSP